MLEARGPEQGGLIQLPIPAGEAGMAGTVGWAEPRQQANRLQPLMAERPMAAWSTLRSGEVAAAVTRLAVPGAQEAARST